MTYDTAKGVAVLFGGHNGGGDLADTWLWNGANWMQVGLAVAPLGRGWASMAYDNSHRRVVLVDGVNSGGPGYLGDTWLFH